MSHSCEHEHTHGHGDHGHEHTPPAATYATQSLYPYIDTTKVRILNGCSAGPTDSAPLHKTLLKPHSERFDTTRALQSDQDAQLIVHLPLLGPCKLQSVILRCAQSEEGSTVGSPRCVKLLKDWNRHLDFDTVGRAQCQWQFEQPNVGVPAEVIASADLGDDFMEHHIPRNKGSTVCQQSVTLFFEDCWPPSTLARVYYLELRGVFQGARRTAQPLVIGGVYESAPNPLDHQAAASSATGVDLSAAQR